MAVRINKAGAYSFAAHVNHIIKISVKLCTDCLDCIIFKCDLSREGSAAVSIINQTVDKLRFHKFIPFYLFMPE